MQDESKRERATVAVLSDKTPVIVNWSIRELWVFRESIRLASEHPSISGTLSEILSRIVGVCTGAIIKQHPTAAGLFSRRYSEKQFIKRATPIMADETNIPITFTVQQVYLSITALQLATRHESMDETTKRINISTGRSLQRAIIETHPEACELLETGWNSQYDIE